MKRKEKTVYCKLCGTELCDYLVHGFRNFAAYPSGPVCKKCRRIYQKAQQEKVYRKKKEQRISDGISDKPAKTDAEMKAWNKAHPIRWQRPTIEELAGSSTGCNKIGSGGKVNGISID